MKFKDFPYERIDLEARKAALKEIIKDLKEAACKNCAKKAFLAMQKQMSEIETMATIAKIRTDVDGNDKFYAEEESFWNNAMPELEEYFQQFKLEMLNSKFRPDLEAEYGNLYFLNAEIDLKTFSPEIIPDLQKENELVQAYNKLIASAKIPFDGKEYTIAQIEPLKSDKDDDLRLRAWAAQGKWYKDNQAELDRIYDELVKKRTEIGKKLGYDGYTELGYYRMNRNCYDKHDVEKFREAVRTYVVPLAARLHMEQAERIGKSYPMNFADNNLMFRSGNPKPVGTADDIVKSAKKFYDELSPETSEFFNTMLDMELMDLVAKEGKRAGGYCTSLPEYHVPFIFSNFNGTQGDVEVVTHEAGHAFEGYLSRNIVPLEYGFPTMEACEVHSMSMEFFAWKASEDFFGPDKDKFQYSHLAAAISFIPYGTMVDHFQHIMYEKPELTKEERHAVWKELIGIYQPWLKFGPEIPFYGDGMGWQRQLHIYNYPFYYIDYCLAQTVSLEYWALSQKDYKGAWDKYMKYTMQGGSKTFTELLKNADMVSPFEGSCLKDVCETAGKWLDNFNKDALK
ncbi:MAG: M3 family oligoendopeptidase [Clostridia bacterium]|nr:M3 family oligoendopeptidase [Clostridia bacterium]